MTRINHHHLFIFWNFSKLRSFSKTAEALRIAQSAVTKQLQSLEEQLGFQLIDRSDRRDLKITEEGRMVLQYADSIFQTSEELENMIRNQSAHSRRLRVGALSGLSRNLQYEFLEPLIEDTKVHIEVTSADQERLITLLENHQLDVVLSSHQVTRTERARYFSHILMSSKMILVWNQTKSRGKRLEELLAEHPLYLPGVDFEVRAEIDAFFDRIKVKPQVVGEIADIALLRLFALKSGALVCLPEMGVVHDLAEKSLKIVHVLPNIEQKFFAVTREKRFQNPSLEKLIRRLQQQNSGVRP